MFIGYICIRNNNSSNNPQPLPLIMKKVLVAALMLSASVFSVNAQDKGTWKIDNAHSSIGFGITHMGISEVTGQFKKFDATLESSSEKGFADSKLVFTADVNTINTDNDMRDGHIKGPDYFASEKFPELKFVSKTFKKVSEKEYSVTGDLTLKGVTKPVTLTAKFNGTGTNMQKKTVSGWKVTGTIKRVDFGVGTSGMGLSDDVLLNANAELVKQ